MKSSLLYFFVILAGTFQTIHAQNLVFDVDCTAGTDTFSYCYDSNDNSTYTFTSTTGAPVFLEFLAGTIESGFDDITVYDSADNSGNVLFSGDNGGDLAGLNFQSTGDSLFIEVDSDGSISCQSSTSYTPWEINYRCVTCISPTATYDIVSNCANGNDEFFIDVIISDIGDAENINIVDDQSSPVQTTTVDGTFTFGPFPNGTPVNITVEDADDINCILESGTLSQGFCPQQECDIINAGADAVFGCASTITEVNLSATFMTSALTTNTSVYTIDDLECPLSNLDGTPTGLNIDDTWSQPIDLGFKFEFFGVTYNQVVVGANGIVSFDTNLAGEFCPWSYEPDELLPTPDLPTNAVFGPYHDIDPSVGGQIEFITVGVAPQRQFKVSFVHVPHFSCNELLTTSQIILYEASNVIDVIIKEKPSCQNWNDGLAVVGIQNSLGTTGYTPEGRNTGDWVVSFQELWRFIPDGAPNYVFEWFDDQGNSLGNNTDITVSPTQTSVYTATVTYTEINGIEIIVSDDVTVSLIDQTPNAGIPQNLVNCENANGNAFFDLTSQDDAIFDGQTDVSVTYYESSEDAENGVNAITNANNYENTSNPQNIYFRLIINTSFDCFSTGSFQIEVFESPIAGVPQNIESCSSTPNNTEFDLTIQDSDIIDGQTDVTLNYYLSLVSAENGTDAILNPSTYSNSSNPETIFFRLESDESSECFDIGSFQLQVFETPVPGMLEDLTNCSNAQGSAEFDLSSQDNAILNGQMDINVAYFESQSDAENDTGEIMNPTTYTNTSNPQTIYYRLEQNSLESCFTVGSFNLGLSSLDGSLVAFNQGCNGNQYEITISAIGNSFDPNTISYEWFGPVGADLTNNTNATFITNVDGQYTVEITNLEGCVYDFSTDVLNANCIFPQGISPNGDMLNDTWDLSGFNVLRLQIFNRNGRSVYTKQNYTNEWVGQSSDGELPVGTYFYVAELENNETRNGWVYIQR